MGMWISIEDKARELIGCFHHSSRCWSPKPIAVVDHDFPSAAPGLGILYGAYDTVPSEGFIL